MSRCSRSGLLILALAPALAACGHGPPVRFLTLDAVGPSHPASLTYEGPPVQVQAVSLPAELDRLEVVQRSGPDTLSVDEFSRWGASPGALSRRALSQDLATRLPPADVVFPTEPAPPATLGLRVELRAFQDGPGGATLDVSWTVLAPAAQGHAVLAHRSERLAIGSAGRGSDAVAAELSQLLGLLADDIAADLAAGAGRREAAG